MDQQQAISSIMHAIDQILEEGRRLPDSILQRKPEPEKWSVLEVLCHVEEVIPYWLHEVEMLTHAPGSEWGRGIQDPARLEAVANAGTRTAIDVLNGIEASKPDVEKIIGSLTEQQLQAEAPSRNPRFGTKPLSFLIDHLLVEHLEKHISQIKRNIAEFHQQ